MRRLHKPVTGDVMRLGLALLGLLLAIMPAGAATLTISGEVTYLERMALPPDGVLRISLVDMAAPDQPRVKAEGAIATPGQVPLTFRFNLDDKVIATDRQYGLRAEILSGLQLWFRNAEPVPVELTATENLRVLVSFVGEARAAPVDTAPLLGVTWTPVEIGGLPVRSDESTLSIGADNRTGGRGGCNSYFTQARLDGALLSFAPVAATRMACAETIMAQEAVFFAALAETRSWRIVDTRLELLGLDAKVLMRLAPSSP